MISDGFVGKEIIANDALPHNATVLILHDNGEINLQARKTEKAGISLFVGFGLKELLTDGEELAKQAIKTTEDYLANFAEERRQDDSQTESGE